MSREPEVPSDTPEGEWEPDDVTSEGTVIDLGVPDDPPDEPLIADEVPELPFDLEAPDDLDDGTWVPDPDVADDPLPSDPSEPLILSWREMARLPEHGVEIAAILDPTVATSSWIVPVHAPAPNLSLLVEIGAFSTRIDVAVREGRTPELRLGRDALAGKVLVRP